MHSQHHIGIGLYHLEVDENHIAAHGVSACDHGLRIMVFRHILDLAREQQFALILLHIDIIAELHLDHAVTGLGKAG